VLGCNATLKRYAADVAYFIDAYEEGPGHGSQVIVTKKYLVEHEMVTEKQAYTKQTIRDYMMGNMFCHPQGILGHVGGQLMSLDLRLPSEVLDLLEVAPTDSVLEIGSGPGVGLELAAARADHGRVVGVDLSETMLAMAHRRNHAQIGAGRIDLFLSPVAQLPFDGASFDKAMTMNSLHLWPDPVAGLNEIRRVLRPGGRIAVAITRYSYASPDQFGPCLSNSGFMNVSIHTGDAGTCALAYK
jgi:SAM-dependent methyltransferase